jgi:lysyl-tRNA synthetase class 2
MSRVLNNHPTLVRLSHRAELLFKIRQFFVHRNVMEVDTPILCKSTTTDPHIDSMSLNFYGKKLFLQTSPEFPMKKLLSEGSGAIYQICKVFRSEQHGRYHHPEFTMLEWYRPDFDHLQLMDEIDKLMDVTGGFEKAVRRTYRDVFLRLTDIDPLTASTEKCRQYAIDKNIAPEGNYTKDDWLDFIFTFLIQSHLIQPTFIYDYPASQGAFAKIREGNPPVAERFELFVNGIELANGYHEVCDSKEQRLRFQAHNDIRKQMNKEEIPIDEPLLAALDKGFPDCAGVALGLDRLLMLISQSKHISEAINFTEEISE